MVFQNLEKLLLILCGLIFLSTLGSCVEEEFYEKEFLEGVGIPRDNPSDDPTDGGAGPLPPPPPQPDPQPVPNPGPQGPNVQSVTDTFFQKSNGERNGDVDILWVMDNSGSMGDDQQNLASNFGVFINDFVQKNVDFQMAITTTDVRPNHIGETIGDPADLNVTAANLDQQQFIQDFQDAIRVGVRGSGNEQGLRGAEAWMTQNANWYLRNDAFLTIIVVSDEQENSQKLVSEYLSFFRGLKENPGMVKIYSIVTSDPNAHRAYYGSRYIQASNETGGLVADINQNFHTTLTDLGGRIVQLTESFALSQLPYQADDLKVFVDGVELLSGWSYDSVARTISFDAGSVPAIGAKIDIVYNVLIP